MMPFCLIHLVVCLLSLPWAMGRPRGALRAQTGCRGRASPRAHGPLLAARGALRAQAMCMCMCLPGNIHVVLAGWSIKK
jgi:hypothetical protein